MELPSFLNLKVDLAVVGGGPAGYMAAITAAEAGVRSVLVLEASSRPLEKVRISGGGRCNVTHACWDPSELVCNYPRGKQPLLGPFSRFAPGDVVSWFEDKGLQLVIEPDGRMFPASNTSADVINCLQNAANDLGVTLRKLSSVIDLKDLGSDGFALKCRDGTNIFAQKILLSTGSHPTGRRLARNLGHSLIESVPSLFSLEIAERFFVNCAGIALDNVHLCLHTSTKSFEETGRVLFTHRGVSGPAVLKLTAFAARALKKDSYKSKLTVNWLSKKERSFIKRFIDETRYSAARRSLGTCRPFQSLPKRFWASLLNQVNANAKMRWADLTLEVENDLIRALTSSNYLIVGRGPFGEEFVTAGGVSLDEVDLVHMESKLFPGLHFAGELLDIDGITGGFNFQHCWTSGWLAGKAIAQK